LFQCPFFETSAKRRLNVDETFFALVKEVQKETQEHQKKPKKPMSTRAKLMKKLGAGNGDQCSIL
jgi:hypothetical protein